MTTTKTKDTTTDATVGDLEVVTVDSRAVLTPAVADAISLMRVSEGLFKSGLFPGAVNSYGAFAIVEYGHELGLPPMVALQNIKLIKGQFAISGQALLSKALTNGVTYIMRREDNDGCEIEFRKNELTYLASFDSENAKRAGLLDKDNWKTYPKDMYFWRAVARGIRRIAPEVVMGLVLDDEAHNLLPAVASGKAPSEEPTTRTEQVKQELKKESNGTPTPKELKVAIVNTVTLHNIDHEVYATWLKAECGVDNTDDIPDGKLQQVLKALKAAAIDLSKIEPGGELPLGDKKSKSSF